MITHGGVEDNVFKINTFQLFVSPYDMSSLAAENLTGPAQSNSFPVGSFIPVWAYVEQHAHQPLVLLLDECVASNSIELEPTTKVYPIITNHG